MSISFQKQIGTHLSVRDVVLSLVLAAGALISGYGSPLQAAGRTPVEKESASVVQPRGQKSSYFQEHAIDQAIVAIALPLANGRYSLNVYRQLSDERACWSEAIGMPTIVEAHMLDFDFTGICGRSTDSNGYSLRINGQDLGMNYRLQLVPAESEVLLQAIPDVAAEPVHTIGSTRGFIPGEMMKIHLDPGWQMTQRVYEAHPLGHIYFSTNIVEQPDAVSPVENQPNMVEPPDSVSPVENQPDMVPSISSNTSP